MTTLKPKSATSFATSAGVPLYESRSFSKISTPRNPAAAIACSFSLVLRLDRLSQPTSSWILSSSFLARDQTASVTAASRAVAESAHACRGRIRHRLMSLNIRRACKHISAPGHRAGALRDSGSDESRFNRRLVRAPSRSPVRCRQCGIGYRVAQEATHADLCRVRRHRPRP